MFGTTDITKIERLLEQVVANQERMLRCWEDTKTDERLNKPADEPEIVTLELAEQEPGLDRGVLQRNGKRKKIFYVTDPLGFIERKIDLATYKTESHKSNRPYEYMNCVYLPALLGAANVSDKGKRPTVTAQTLTEILLELLLQNRIAPCRSKNTNDIGVKLITNTKPMPDYLEDMTHEDFKNGLALFVRWNNG